MAKTLTPTAQNGDPVNRIPDKQWLDWADRIMRGEHLEQEMQNAGALPHADTPLPPTNAAIHYLAQETGYGTRQRRFTALCGVSWTPWDGIDEHKYVTEDYWLKHINCPKCRELMEQGNV